MLPKKVSKQCLQTFTFQNEALQRIELVKFCPSVMRCSEDTLTVQEPVGAAFSERGRWTSTKVSLKTKITLDDVSTAPESVWTYSMFKLNFCQIPLRQLKPFQHWIVLLLFSLSDSRFHQFSWLHPTTTASMFMRRKSAPVWTWIIDHPLLKMEGFSFHLLYLHHGDG